MEAQLKLWKEIGQSFRGRSRGIVIVVWIETLLLFGVAAYAAVRFFDVTSTRELVGFAALFVVAFLSGVAVKVWYYNLLHRFAVIREIRKVAERLDTLERHAATQAQAP